MSKVTSLSPEAFQRAVREFAHMSWRDGLAVEEIGSPQRIAPFALAISGELGDGPDPISTGRLILLHDPAGNPAWEGTFRLVTYARANVDIDMVADPLLPEVAWSWFLDALSLHDCAYNNPAGTVTASYGRSFGSMEHHPETAEVELRASWTPILSPEHSLTAHLGAWQDLLGLVAGEPPLPQGVARLRNDHAR